jgi:tetratricopeptide (TPR) repeat protein
MAKTTKASNQSVKKVIQPVVEKKKSPAIFYVILILIPFLFFALFEGGLRLFDYGRNYECFVPSKKLGHDMLELNPNISYKYFNNVSVFNSDFKFFYKDKRKNSFRVFVIGESSAQGFPYNINASFPNYIKRRLDLLYPEKEVEMVNLGASAINSFTMLDILPEVLKQAPDLILIYAGHNEYYGALGAASTMSLGNNRSLVNFMIYLRGFKTVELMRNALLSFKGNGEKNDHTPLMQKMIGESSIAFGSDTYKNGLESFEGNLNEMLEMIHKKNVPVIMGTLTSNLKDQKPFVSLAENGQDANSFFAAAKAALKAGEVKTAKAAFVKAKELDGLRFRAPEAINDIIKRKAKDLSIPLVDVDSIFNANADSAVVGYELICDHLHPNVKGYQLLAKAFFEAMIKNKFLPQGEPVKISAVKQDSIMLASFPYTALDSSRSDYVINIMLHSYPFVPKDDTEDIKNKLTSKFVDKMARLGNVDSARNIVAYYYLKGKNYHSFSKEMNAIIRHDQFKEVHYLNMLIMLSDGKMINEAYPYILEALKEQKTNASIYKMTGLLNQMAGKSQEAIDAYTKGITLRPEDEQFYFNRAVAYQSLQNFRATLDDYAKAVELNPEYVEAYHNRGVLRYNQNDFAGAVEDFNEIIKLKPKNSMAYIIRGRAKKGINDNKGSCEDWKKAADLGSSEGRYLYSNSNCR